MIARTTRTAAARLLLGASLLALPLASAACRDSGDEGGSDGNPDARPSNTPDGGPDNPDDTTIYEIQGDLAEDLAINVRGVVVVAIDNYGNNKYGFYVAEPTGAREYSGVAVFNRDPVLIADIAVGDLVDLEGVVKDEFVYDDASSFGPSLTQLRAPRGGTFTVTKVGTGTVPQPVVVDAVAIGMLATAAEREAWEPYEGVLVRTTNAAVTAGYSQIGDTDPTFKEFRIKFETRVDSGLSELPATLAVGDCYAAVTGIVDYFFNFKIVPRQPSDIDTTPGTCAAPTATTVDAIQRGTVTGDVSLSNVVLVARDDVGPADNTNFGFWVADAAQAAQYQGLYVYVGNQPADAALTVGSTLNIVGTVGEFDVSRPTPPGNSITQINRGASITKVDRTAVSPLPLANPPTATVTDITNGEPFEGVLVRFDNLRVAEHLAQDDLIRLVDGTGASIHLDDDAFDFAQSQWPVDTCLQSVTGIMSVQLVRDLRTLNPRSAADVVVVSPCPAAPAPAP